MRHLRYSALAAVTLTACFPAVGGGPMPTSDADSPVLYPNASETKMTVTAFGCDRIAKHQVVIE